MNITIIYHKIDCFYNVRVPKGLRTISQSTQRMRKKIYNVEGVKWKQHVVLTFNEQNYEKYKGKIDSSVLRTYFNKLKKIFPNLKYFWKYEQGRERERPHFHLLLDLKEKLKDKRTEIEKVVDVGDVRKFIERERKYEMNETKTNDEIVMGYFMYKLWGKGIGYVRVINNELELVEQVEKDVAKRTGTEGFKANKRKYGFSRGLKVKKEKKESEYEWVENTKDIYYAKGLVESTKDNFIEHFLGKGYEGNVIYERTMNELNELRKGKEKVMRISEFQ